MVGGNHHQRQSPVTMRAINVLYMSLSNLSLFESVTKKTVWYTNITCTERHLHSTTSRTVQPSLICSTDDTGIASTRLQMGSWQSGRGDVKNLNACGYRGPAHEFRGERKINGRWYKC